MLIIAIDFNIVYVALPEIGHALDFSAQSLQWVVSAYAVTWGGFLLLGGRAVDRLGPRRMFVSALGLYAVSSMFGGFASNGGLLLGARAFQGLGAAVLFPASLALINLNFAEGPQRNRAMGAWGATAASGLIVGSAAGGVLTHSLGWPWVFVVNVPLAAGAAVAAVRLLDRDPQREIGNGSFDLPGALLATGGAMLVVFGLASGPEAGWVSIRVAGTLAAGALLFGLFMLVERWTVDALMPLRLFGNRSLVVAIALVVVFMTAINSLHYVFFIYLQDVLGYDALRAGLAFVPISVGGMVGSMKALPVLLNRWGTRATLFLGMLGIGVSMAGLAPVMSPHNAYWAMLPGTLLWGFSAGIAFSAIFLTAASGVSATEQGVASAMASTAQQIGGAIGLAALVAVANAGIALSNAAPSVTEVVAGLRTAIWVGAVVTVGGAFLALALSNTPRGRGPRDAVHDQRSVSEYPK
jgi:MFS family permease